MANASVTHLDSTIVRVESDCGTVGWGETCPVGPTYAPSHAEGARAALTEMAPHLIGTDLDKPVLLNRKMDSLLNGHRYAKAAIDIAAYDAIGKKTGRSVADLLRRRGHRPGALLLRHRCGRARRDRPHRAGQSGRGLSPPANQNQRPSGRDRYRSGPQGVGSRGQPRKTCRRWQPRHADPGCAALSQACRDIPFVLEQPCDTLEEIAAIRAQLCHPVYLDEGATDLPTVIRAANGLVDGFGMKITRIGGLTPMATFRNLCEARHLPHTVDDSWGGDIIAAACVQLGATVSPKTYEGTWLAQPYIEGHYDPSGGVKIEDGHIAVPTGPGLGITPDPTLFSREVAQF